MTTRERLRKQFCEERNYPALPEWLSNSDGKWFEYLEWLEERDEKHKEKLDYVLLQFASAVSRQDAGGAQEVFDETVEKLKKERDLPSYGTHSAMVSE